jgi:hypothetical protein
MEKIPKHCIEIFVKTFDEHPSVIEIPIPLKNEGIIKNIDKLIGKSELIWTHIQKVLPIFGEDKMKDDITQLLMYDKAGVMLYVHNNTKIFILTTVNRLNVTEFTVNNILKTK